MYLYELAVSLGERSTDLIERAKMLGFEVGPHDELTKAQVDALTPGGRAADRPIDASFGGSGGPDASVPSGDEGPKKRFGRKRSGEPEAGPVISTPGAGGIGRWVILAVPVVVVGLAVLWFVARDADDLGSGGPDEAAIGEEVRSEELSGDPHGVSDRVRFCDEGGRLIVLLGGVPRTPSTADLREVYVDEVSEIRGHLDEVIKATEGDTRDEAREYRRRLLAIADAVAGLPSSGRVDSLPAGSKTALLRAIRQMDQLGMSKMDAAMAAHC